MFRIRNVRVFADIFPRAAHRLPVEVIQMRWMKPAAALTLFLLLLTTPETTLNAAREAMRVWATAVAPALFPFMALTPLLTCRESARACEAAAGRWMRPLFGLPGAAAPAVIMGLAAGSPAGMRAARALAAESGLTRGELERISLCCGLSPAFLITGIGASMLGSAADGRMLAGIQLTQQLILLSLSRFFLKNQEPVPAGAAAEPGNPVAGAVTGTLTVCGYMILFRAAAAGFAGLCGNPVVGRAALCLLDAPSGAQAICEAGLPRRETLLLLAAAASFGGLCVGAQNLAVGGVRPGIYFIGKLAAALAAAGATALRLNFPVPAAPRTLPVFPAATLCAVILTVPLVKTLLKNIFLNKKNFREQV